MQTIASIFFLNSFIGELVYGIYLSFTIVSIEEIARGQFQKFPYPTPFLTDFLCMQKILTKHQFWDYVFYAIIRWECST